MRATHGGSNRVILTLLGLVLLLAGAGWLLVNLEPTLGVWSALGLQAPDPTGRVLDLPITGWRGALLLGGLALVALVIGLWLALRQVPSTDAVSSYTWTPPDQNGSTKVEATALGQAIADDALHLTGVAGAKVLLFGAAVSPELLIQVTVDDRSHIPSVLRSLEEVVLPNAQDAIGTDLRHVGIRVRTGGRAESAAQVAIPAQGTSSTST